MRTVCDTQKYTKTIVTILILIGVDGAEGEVLRRGHAGLGEDVEEGGLAHVGEAHDSALEVRPHAADQHLLLLLHVLLLGRHLGLLTAIG